MTDLRALLQGADVVAARAAAEIVEMQRRDIDVTRKEHLDVVTAADLASEKLVLEGRRALTPRAAILFEEAGERGARRWPALDRRSARRHDQLCGWLAVVLGHGRLSGGRAHEARHHPFTGIATPGALPRRWPRHD